MCGRYALYGPAKLTRAAQRALEHMQLDIMSQVNQREGRYNIAPTQQSLVIAMGGEGAYEVKPLRWGLIPSWSKDEKIGAKTINARAETVAEKPAFRHAFKKHRCLVPASGYFEWTGAPGSKQPYFIHDPEGDLLLFAGLWEAWRPGADAEWVRTFTVITGEPGKVSGDIHDRQPVILPPDAWVDWLTGEPDVAQDVLTHAPEASLSYFPVTRAVGNVRNHGAELVEPITL